MTTRGILIALLALLVAAPAALAQTATESAIVERAIDALRTDRVYVDPGDERVDASDAQQLRERIRAAGGGIYVAVLPAEAGEADEVIRTIAEGVRRPGTYAVVVGNRFRAGSVRDLPRGRAGSLAREALAARGEEGVAPTLNEFVDRVGAARGGRSGGSGRDGDGGGDGGGGSFLAVILAVAAGVGGLLFFRRRRQQQQELAEVKQAAQDDLLALAEDIRALDLDVEMPGADPAAKEDYARAVELYDQADRALDRARTPGALEPVTAAIEEGRFAMASAKARLAGKRPPERRPPCLFDPRHGPSDREVEWAPPSGQPRLVPACEADALRVEEGLEPAAREVLVGGQPTPYWNAPARFGPWAGGYFGGMAGGLFPGLLIGSLLGGALTFPGAAYGGGGGGGGGDGGGGDFGGDDFGGGDFGGGDFGGGDFGGGDFGGGDFGGGDFGGGQ